MTYDTIIIGGGPAGVAAGVYAARKKLKTLVIAESFGGQSIVADSIENWIGAISISGAELAQSLEKHLRAQEDIEIKMPEKVVSVKELKNAFEITTDKGNTFKTKTLIVASGGRRRRLNVPGEDKFEGKGVSYCSTCDAPLFRDKTVAVIGGGNAGLEAVTDLFPYANKIYLIVRNSVLKGDPITQEEVKKNPKAEIIYEAETQEILGNALVTGIKYLDKKSITAKTGQAKTKELKLDGVFVEIGSVPNSDFLKGIVRLDKWGDIVIDPKTGATSKPGIFAAGDVTDEIYRQNNIAAGDAVKALLAAYDYLLKNK